MGLGFTSDKRKLIVALSVLLTIGFAAIALVSYFISRASIHESIVASALPLTSDNIYSEIQKDLVRPVLISSLMASDTFLRDWIISGERDPSLVTRYLRDIKERYGAFTTFLVSERTRVYYQTEGVLKKIKPDDQRDAWYFRVRDMKAPYELNLDPDAANKDTLTIFINYRVLDYQGRYLGAAGIGLAVDSVRKLVERYQQRYNRRIYFVDKQGRIALYGAGPHEQGASILAMDGLGRIAQTILAQGGGTFEYSRDQSKQLLNVRFIPELDWYLFVEQSEHEATARIRNALYASLALSALITVIVLVLTSVTISRYQRRVEEMATTDKLTGLANRQAFELLVPQAMKESVRAGGPLLAILIDIDHFKSVNDRLGHLAGDRVLADVGQVIVNALRSSDLVFRWGGEEYLVILKGTAEAEGERLAEKIRAAVQEHAFGQTEAPIAVTISLGLASCRTGDTPDTLVARADAALYRAKAAGRNTVSSAG